MTAQVSNWKDLLGQADALFKKAIDLHEDAEATMEQKNHIPEIIAEATTLKEKALELKNIYEARSRIAEQMNIGLDEIKNANQARETQAMSPDHFKDWEEYLFAVWQTKANPNVTDPRLRFFKDKGPSGHESKQMSGAAGASGGFLIPTQFIPTLQAVQAEEGIVRGAGPTIIRMISRQVSLPVLDQTGTTAKEPHWFGGMKFYWGEEGEEKDSTEAKFRRINLVAKKLYGYTYASDELVTDSAISLADFISGPLGFAGGVAWMEDYAFLRGVGGAQPVGMMNAPCRVTVNRVTAGTIDFRDLVDMLSSFLPGSTGQWAFTHSAMSDIIQMTGPTGNASYVWQPNAREGIPGFVLGYPVRWTEKLPVEGTEGDAMLFDARYYLVGDRQATTIDTTKFDRWRYDQTSWRVVHRVDGQPWLSDPITYQDGETEVSPIVVLTDVSGS